MSSFPLKIVTPDGMIFDGEAERLIVRTTSGDVAIMARHVNYVTPLGMGQAVVIQNGQRRIAACIGGMLSVLDGAVTLVPTTFEWASQIDKERAENAYRRASAVLEKKEASDVDMRLAEAKLRRALIRKSIASSSEN